MVHFLISWKLDKESILTVTPQRQAEGPNSKIQARRQLDNARHHTCLKVKDYVANSGCIVLHHPPYSSDLASSEFSFVSGNERWTTRTTFST